MMSGVVRGERVTGDSDANVHVSLTHMYGFHLVNVNNLAALAHFRKSASL
jgi:hypothetical protein